MLENFSTKRRRQNTSSEESYAGPACINPQLPTTPLSPARTRQRRTQGSSLDAVSDGEIYEEDYRTGGPHLCRLPAVNGHLKNDSPTLSIWKNNLEDTVRDILSKFAVRFTTVALLHRQSRHDQEHNPTEDLTILVIAVKEMMDNKWYSACVEIRSACLDAGLGSMNVEIADERGLQPTLSHPISAHEPFAVQWYQIRPRVIALLGRQTWLSISLLRRGTSEDDRECPVTIVITIPEDSDSLWSGARDSIAAMLDSEGWYEVAVEIGRGSIWRGPQGTSAVRNRYLLEPERDWKTAAQMGRSVGRRDTSKTSGTLGGFIEILSSDTDEWKRYGLTCFQCVLPPSGESIPHREDLEKHGIQDGAHGIEMDQPSSGDHQETLRFHQEGIDDLRAQIHKLTELTLKDPDDSTTADRKRSIKKDQRTIESIEEKMELGREYFRQNQQHLGTVFAGSSSRRGENGCTLDWALIEVKPERVSSNKLLQLGELRDVVRSEFVTKSMVVGFKLYNRAEKKVVGAQVPVISGQNLFKFGSTTDFTWGKQNGVRECLLKGWREDEGGILRPETHDECQVLGRPASSDQCFGDAGDSGSFVLSGSGEFVGLLFGGNTHSNTAPYKTAEDLFALIKSVTGAAEVRLPDLELNEANEMSTL